MLLLRPEYPNKGWGKNKPFNWYLCSKKVYSSKYGFYILELSISTKLYDAKTGKIYQPSKELKLFLLSDAKNKTFLRNEGFKIDCDSDKCILSTECGLTTNPAHLREIGRHILKKKYADGLAVRHDSFLENDKECVCHEITFLVKKTDLTPFGECDDRSTIIRYAKKYNSAIRKVDKNFPALPEIDKAIRQGQCANLAKSVYPIIYIYMSEKR